MTFDNFRHIFGYLTENIVFYTFDFIFYHKFFPLELQEFTRLDFVLPHSSGVFRGAQGAWAPLRFFFSYI